jgi:hypothetical protein
MNSFLRSLLTKSLVLIVIILAFTGYAAILPSTNESLDWNTGNFVLVSKEKTGWKGIRGDETERLIYVKQGEEKLEKWTEKAEVTELPIAITLSGRVHWNPESVMNSEKASLQKKQCSTDMWTVIQKDETSILYEWQNIRCPGYFHQHEIVRILMGRWYLWMISYGIRDKVLTADERRELIENLLKAKVVHDRDAVR